MGSPADAAVARRSEAFAAAMLVLACLCWGGFFSLAKNWQQAAQACPGGPLVASLTLIGVRPLLALLVFAMVRPQLFREPTRQEWLLAAFLGALNFTGNVFQVWGLNSTTPARSGFFTSMASLWVPVIALLFLRISVAGATWLGILLGILGVSVLALDSSQGWGLNAGDALTILASMIFAAFILCLDRFGRRVRSSHLTLGLIAFAGLPALPMAVGISAAGSGIGVWFDWLRDMASDSRVVLDVLFLTLLSTVLATYLMGTFQPRVAASRAALIYLFEPVFAAVISVIVGHDEVHARLVLGGLLILGGNALSELPAWLRTRPPLAA
jgi:drug/metabolite transporter (DMT)-like permease